MSITWKYNSEGTSTVKHAFYAPARSMAVCGTQIIWHSNAKWKTDKKGLEGRSECRRCVRVLK